MKRILIALAIAAFFCVGGHAQFERPLVQPQLMPYSYYRFPGYLQADSGILLPQRVANFTPKRSALIYDTGAARIKFYLNGWKALQDVAFTGSYTSLVDTPTNVTTQGNTFNGAYQLLQLDNAGKVYFANLPSTLMTYKGTWSAATNTPALANGTGVSGWMYQAIDSGVVDFGSGPITFFKNDYVGYNGSVWQWSPGNPGVRSVNGFQNIVSLTTVNIPESGSVYYWTAARSRAAQSVTATGLTYDNSTGVISLTVGYTIPLTTDLANWNTAYSWGNWAAGTHYVGTTLIANNRASGAQTLTGVSIDGNAATATTTSYWGVVPNSLNSPAEASGLTNLIGVHSNGYAYKFTVGAVQSWLGLGSNAYTSTSFLPLSGGTLTGALVGTSISLSGALGTGGDLYIPNNFSLYGRNYGNSAWIQAIGINASEKISIDANAYGTVFGGSITAGSINGTTGMFSSYITSQWFKRSGTGIGWLLEQTGYVNRGLYWDESNLSWDFYENGTPRIRLKTDGSITSIYLSGSGNRIVYANASGTLGSMVIGSGLSFDGTTLSATGGSSGTVTGSGTSGYIPLWNSASDIGNSVMSQSGSAVTVAGSFTISGASDLNLPANRNIYTNGYRIATWNTSSELYLGDIDNGYTNTIIRSGGVDRLTFTNAGAATFSSSVTASSFSGAGTGLTGTASGLTAGAANVAYTWDSYSGVYSSGTIQYVMIFNSTASKFQSITAAQMQSWLGLGPAAYLNANLSSFTNDAGFITNTTSSLVNYYTATNIQNFFSGASAITGYNYTNWNTAYSWGNHAGLYLPLTGGTLTGALNGTTAYFTGTVTAGSFFEIPSDIRKKEVVQRWASADGMDAIAYYLKDDISKKIMYGFEAQQVMKVLPTAVATHEDKTMADGITYSVGYTQVLVYKIAMLEKRIENLENAIKK